MGATGSYTNVVVGCAEDGTQSFSVMRSIVLDEAINLPLTSSDWTVRRSVVGQGKGKPV